MVPALCGIEVERAALNPWLVAQGAKGDGAKALWHLLGALAAREVARWPLSPAPGAGVLLTVAGARVLATLLGAVAQDQTRPEGPPPWPRDRTPTFQR